MAGDDWSIDDLKPTIIVGVDVNLPNITLKCVALPKSKGGLYETPLDEIYEFEKLKAIVVNEVNLINGGTFVWADRRHELKLIQDGKNCFYGVVEDVNYNLDEYHNEMIEYEIKLLIQLPSDMTRIGTKYYFDDELFSENVFFL